jgi:hypothetical protein
MTAFTLETVLTFTLVFVVLSTVDEFNPYAKVNVSMIMNVLLENGLADVGAVAQVIGPLKIGFAIVTAHLGQKTNKKIYKKRN